MPSTTPTLEVRSWLADDSPDPAVLRVGDRWYAYSTQVGFLKVPVRSSDDLRSWSAPVDAMPDLASWADVGAHWAPSVTASGDGRYVLWYAARQRTSGRQCVSRAVAGAPEGPFVDELATPPIAQVELGGSIDPFVFDDGDGRRWLYWKSDENAVGNRSRLWVAPLSADATMVTGTATALLRHDRRWEVPTIEQPAVVRVGDDYYLFYSGGSWESPTYGIGFAVGPSPTGPFAKVTTGRAWVGSGPGAAGPGALDPFSGPEDELWAAVHAWAGPVGYAAGGRRTTRFATLGFDPGTTP